MEYKTGDKVQLISGGPEMTVNGIIGTDSLEQRVSGLLKLKGNADGDVYCQWFVGSTKKGGVFKPQMLKKLQ